MDNIFEQNFKLTGLNNDPTSIDFNKLGLHKQRTIVKGELISIKLHRIFSGGTYDDLVVEERRTFNRDIYGVVINRNLEIDYYFEDGTIGLTNVLEPKYYIGEEAIKEGVDRRNNIINEGKYYLLTQVGQTNAFDFLLGVKTQMGYFIDGYTAPLKDAVSATTKPYMTTEIKDNLAIILTT